MLEERIIFEDQWLLAFNKNPEELVQADREGNPSLIDLLQPEGGAKGSGPRFFFPIHRLDRPASGIVLFAKSKTFFSAMTGLFRERKIEKTYWAVIGGEPPMQAGRLTHLLATNHKKNKTIAREGSSAEPANAILDYRVIGKSDRYSFLCIKLITGKQHQIRSQLAAIGCPVKGDVKYGARRGNNNRDIMLHARSISFTHPMTGQIIRVTAPPPADRLWELFLDMAGDEDLQQ
jgi:23S rRNA pseudouridine1911/1915/1917 synthase